MVEVEIVHRSQKKVHNLITAKPRLSRLPLFRRTSVSNDGGRLDAQWLEVKNAGFLISFVKYNLAVGTTLKVAAKKDLICLPFILSGHLHFYKDSKIGFDIFSSQYYLFTMQEGEHFKISNNSAAGQGLLAVFVFKKEYFSGMEDYYNTATRIANNGFPIERKSFLLMDIPLQQILKYTFSIISNNTRPDYFYFKLSTAVRTIMAMVLAEIDKPVNKQITPKWYSDWQIDNIEKVREYLEESYEQFPGIGALIKMAGMNSSTFRRVFTDVTGSKVFEYWNNHRMELAWQWLSSRKLKPVQVALMLGFATSQAFSKQFKKRFSLPPSRVYRGES